MLKPENKLARLTTSHVSLCLYQADPVKFLCIYITREDTLAHHFDSENKLHSKQWKHATSLMLVKFHKTAFAGKVMASVFWDSEEVISDYLLRVNTVMGVYYTELIKKIPSVINEKRWGNLRHGVLHHRDSAQACTSQLPWLLFASTASNCCITYHIL